MRPLLLFLSLFFFTASLQAQYPHPTFKQYTVEDGLPGSDVYQVKQDSKGYIWFATGNGVSRFNGYEFENFSMSDGLPDNTVFEIFEDHSNRIWFLPLSCKLSYYKNGKIHPYEYNDALQKVLKKTVKTSFAVDKDGTVFLGLYRDGIYEISATGKITHHCDKKGEETGLDVLQPDAAHFVYSSGTYPLATKKHTISFKTNILNGTATIPDDINVMSASARIIKYQDNSILLSTYNHLYTFNSAGRYEVQDFDYRILWVYQDADNDLWVGTYLGGVYYIHNGDFKNKSHYLPGYAVTGVLQDKEGGLWFCTEGNGVFYTPSKHILTFDDIAGISNDKINCLVTDTNLVYAGAQDGFVYAISDSIVKKINTNTNGDRANNISNLFYDPVHRQVFVSGKTEAGEISKNTFHNAPLKFGSFNAITMDEQDHYWIASSNSLDNYIISPYSRNAVVSDKRLNAVIGSKKNELLVGESDGLWRFNKATNAYTPVIDKAGLLSNRILDLAYTPDSLLIIGTKGIGLLIYDNGNVYQVDKKKGLCGDNVYNVFCEGKNTWVATNNGLNKITIRSRLPFQYEIKSYTTVDGLASNEINSVLKRDDKIWVATNKGICVFEAGQKIKSFVKIPLYVTKISINDNNVAADTKYELSYAQNNIKINFTGLGFKNAGKLQYRYKMEGLDTSWTYTQNREVQYTTLPPNNYHFVLSVLNSTGEWDESAVQISFTIHFPFWQKWWFRILMAALIVAIAVLIFRYRINLVKKQEERNSELNKTFLNLKLKALRAQMNPHFTFNVMNSIQHFILTKDNESAHRYLTKFSRLIRSILNNSEHNTLPVAEEIKALELYLELESMRFENRFSYELLVDKNIDSSAIQIPSMLIQPYVENAIKHGILPLKENGNIKIEIIKLDGFLKCIIEDNGIGRAKAAENNRMKQHMSMGTSLTKERLMVINELNSSHLSERIIDLFDENNNAAGTRIEIYIPIN